MKQRLLLITNRNILTTCGELRLIKNRAEILYEKYKIATDFIALAKPERINSNAKEQINAGGMLFPIKQDIHNPMSVLEANIKLKAKIKDCLRNDTYNAVVLSGAGMQFYSKLVKSINPSILVYLDVHGACEDNIEVTREASFLSRLIHRLIYFADTCGLKKSADYVDGYFVVTKALSKYLQHNYNIAKNSKFYVVPCATINTGENFFENYEIYRDTYRSKYEIQKNEKVFIYSGGTSSWQCIEETIALFRKIKEAGVAAKLLVFSHDEEKIKKLVGSDQDIIIDSYRPEELAKALCAGDFAFLLRKDCVTNNVAFPNKYLEYVQSKMKIIATPYIYEIAEQISKYNLGYMYSFEDDQNIIDCIKTHSSLNEDSVVLSVLSENCFENKLKPFVDDIRALH